MLLLIARLLRCDGNGGATGFVLTSRAAQPFVDVHGWLRRRSMFAASWKSVDHVTSEGLSDFPFHHPFPSSCYLERAFQWRYDCSFVRLTATTWVPRFTYWHVPEAVDARTRKYEK